MTDVNAAPQESPAGSASAQPAGQRGQRGQPGSAVWASRAVADRTAAAAEAAGRWPLSRIIGVALLALLLFSLAAMVAGGIALLNLHHNRQRLIATLDPAAIQVQQLDVALLDQETGVRGYALSAQLPFLTPYTNGVTEEQDAIKALQAIIHQLPAGAAADLASVIAQAQYWRTRYAVPTINQVSRTGKPVVSPDILTGKADFDALRAKIGVLQAEISTARAGAVAALNDSAAVLDACSSRSRSASRRS